MLNTIVDVLCVAGAAVAVIAAIFGVSLLFVPMGWWEKLPLKGKDKP